MSEIHQLNAYVISENSKQDQKKYNDQSRCHKQVRANQAPTRMASVLVTMTSRALMTHMSPRVMSQRASTNIPMRAPIQTKMIAPKSM